MISVFNGSLISTVLMASGSGALFSAAWILTRLRSYRGAAHFEEREIEGDSEGECRPESAHFDGVQESIQHSIHVDRLLRRDDFDFLAAQPGYTPEIGARLRRDRERILRLYLQDLAGEFHRLHAAARELAASSPDPDAEIVRTLLRQQVAFWFAILRIEVSLAAGRVKRLIMRRPGQTYVELGALLESIEALRLDLARRAAPAEAA